MAIARDVALWRIKGQRLVLRGLLYLVLILLSALFMAPLLWMISTSFKHPHQIFVFPPEWIPRPVMFSNYVDVLPLLNFSRSFSNSLFLSAGRVIGALFSSSLVGYSFACLRWPGRNVLFVVLLSTMMIPYMATMIPVFVVFNSLGWINTYKPLIIPWFFGQSAFYIFLIRQFFLTIPAELLDAARIDGCSEFKIYSRIMLPLSKPVLTVVAIFTFVDSWNDFFGPLIYLNSQENWVLALYLHAMRSAQIGEINWSGIMAGSTLMTLPVILLFFFAQKTFIQGITLTGVKG